MLANITPIDEKEKPNKAIKITKVTKTEDYEKDKYDYILLDANKLGENIINDIQDQLKINPIVIEPEVRAKMMCMMSAVDGKLEIYGKMIVELETFKDIKYVCIKDILIPYQNVTSGSFESTPEQMGKWLNELNKDEEGNLKPVAEVNNITTRLLGHFHSHDSVSGTHPSITDTDDMIEHVKNRKYWIEIIGTKKELSGRIALSNPFNVLISCNVITKWWNDVPYIVKELTSKVYEQRYKVYKAPTYKKKGKNKNNKQTKFEKCEDCSTVPESFKAKYCLGCPEYDGYNIRLNDDYDDDDEEYEDYKKFYRNIWGINEGF